MRSTKENIISVSKQLFHEFGIANTRLQQIADSAEISVGNLVYHYKNKDAIVEAVYNNLFTELTAILSQYAFNYELHGFDRLFSAMYRFYDANKLAFNNQWEIHRNYTQIQQEWLTTSNKITLQIKKRLEYCAANDLINDESGKTNFDTLSQSISLVMHNWMPQQCLRGKVHTELLYKRALWGIILPLLTQKGKTALESKIG